jgi:hypothetical protein
MPTFIRARLPATREQEPHERTGEQELRLDRDARSVTAAAAMEDLLSMHAKPRNEVLEVGHRGGRTAEHRRIERPAPRSEQAERDEPAADLEAPVWNVLVRHTIACDVQRRPEQQRERTRPHDASHRRTGRHVERDDHPPIIAHARLVGVSR